MQPGSCACYFFERSRDEFGLVRWYRRQNGSTSSAGEKRTIRCSVRPKQIERNFLAGDFVLDFFARVQRNIHAKLTQPNEGAYGLGKNSFPGSGKSGETVFRLPLPGDARRYVRRHFVRLIVNSAVPLLS
jgi:hypothetical protein